MRRLIVIVCIAMSLYACSALDWVKPFLPGGNDGISAEAQVGDRNNALGDHEESSQEIDVEDVTGDVSIKSESTKVEQSSEVRVDNAADVRVTNISVWLILLLILGWMLPTPTNMKRDIRNAWKGWMERRALGRNVRSASSGSRYMADEGGGYIRCPECDAVVPSNKFCRSCGCDIRNEGS